jgi:serine/threonine protein kinase
MLLDYAPGGNMTRTLQKEKRFPENRARLYLAEILLALEDLHKRDIIYRDLKPDNIVFDEDGHAMITDFGLSKVGISLSDQARSFCGSPAYLAPEILRRQGHGKPVDWYLLGVLLYEMLVGIPPYYNNNKDILY